MKFHLQTGKKAQQHQDKIAAESSKAISPSREAPSHLIVLDEDSIDNNDMHISPKALALMSEPVRRAMGATEIREAFDRFEAEADVRKKQHDRLGKFALVTLIVVLMLAVLKIMGFALREDAPASLVAFNKVGNILGIACGSLPLLIGWAMKHYRVHEKWLVARYKAERIRHWKFHQLLNGAYIEGLSTSISQDALTTSFDGFVDDLTLGTDAALSNFIRTPEFELSFHPCDYMQSSVAEDAFKVYNLRRLELQIRWFTQNSKNYTEADSWTDAGAKLLLLGGAFFTLLEPLAHLINFLFVRSIKTITPTFVDIWLPGIGLLFILLSTGVRVYRSASGVSESAERYQSVNIHLLQLRNTLRHLEEQNAPQNEKLKVLTMIERVLHAELVEFLRVAQKSDYLI